MTVVGVDASRRRGPAPLLRARVAICAALQSGCCADRRARRRRGDDRRCERGSALRPRTSCRCASTRMLIPGAARLDATARRSRTTAKSPVRVASRQTATDARARRRVVGPVRSPDCRRKRRRAAPWATARTRPRRRASCLRRAAEREVDHLGAVVDGPARCPSADLRVGAEPRESSTLTGSTRALPRCARDADAVVRRRSRDAGDERSVADRGVVASVRVASRRRCGPGGPRVERSATDVTPVSTTAITTPVATRGSDPTPAAAGPCREVGLGRFEVRVVRHVEARDARGSGRRRRSRAPQGRRAGARHPLRWPAEAAAADRTMPDDGRSEAGAGSPSVHVEQSPARSPRATTALGFRAPGEVPSHLDLAREGRVMAVTRDVRPAPHHRRPQ